jgi:hypothetical protein
MRIVTLFALLLTSVPLFAAEPEPIPVVEQPAVEGSTPAPGVETSAVPQASEKPQAVELEPEVVRNETGKDAPSRAARLSLTDGEVSLAPAGTDEWADAVLNRPLTSGDRVWVDRDARAELQVGSATVHLDQNSGFSFQQLDDDNMRMSLTDGSATVRVRRKYDDETIVVETPNASIALLHPGEYHIEVNEAGDQTVVKARSGEAAVTGEKDSYIVRANESGTFKGTKNLAATMAALGPRNSFENWANDRDRREERSNSSRYVSRDVVGYEDLDDDGDWISERTYGYVWTPRHVYAGWAPYRDGRWAWVSPWGWTWVDNARWGYAPFHYGRWTYLRSRWCWVPGPRLVRPVYAPALVGWVGSPGLNVSVGFGSGVGWFPLGPREVYVPGYWHSRRYIQNINVTNTVIVNNRYIVDAYRGRRSQLDYRYRGQVNAVTVVGRDSFVSGRPIGGHLTPVSRGDLRRWHHDVRPPAIAPNHGSVFAGNRSTPFTGRNDRFERADRENAYRNRGSIPVGRVSFDAEQRAIQANGNRPVPRSRLFDDNRTSRTSRTDMRDMGNFSAVRPSNNYGSATKRNAFGNSDRSSSSGNGFNNNGGSVNRDSSPWRDNNYRNRGGSNSTRDNPVAIAPSGSVPYNSNSGSRRDSWRGLSSDRSQPRFENAPSRPTFNSTPRNSREDRSSQRFDRQREARQERIQSMPAQESRPAPQQQSPRGSRGDGNRGGDNGGGKHSGGDRNMNRQSQK